jgi:hypothetical protein
MRADVAREEVAQDYHLVDDASEPQFTWWERWLCGRTGTRTVFAEAEAAAWTNLLWEIVGAATLIWTISTEKLLWSDVYDAIDLALAIPTLVPLLCTLRDLHAPGAWMRCWCWFLVLAYGVGVLWDIADTIVGRTAKLSKHTVTALTDACSLFMWVQVVYYNREVARADAPPLQTSRPRIRGSLLYDWLPHSSQPGAHWNPNTEQDGRLTPPFHQSTRT